MFWIATTIATPLAMLGFAAALLYRAFVRKEAIKNQRIALLPLKERAMAADEALSRYKINAEGATPEEKLKLIQDEMTKRYRLSVFSISITAGTFVACFAMSVIALAIHNPQKRPDPEVVKVWTLNWARVNEPLVRSSGWGSRTVDKAAALSFLDDLKLELNPDLGRLRQALREEIEKAPPQDAARPRIISWTNDLDELFVKLRRGIFHQAIIAGADNLTTF